MLPAQPLGLQTALDIHGQSAYGTVRRAENHHALGGEQDLVLPAAPRGGGVHVQDVPVMWLPFIFQDIRTGRRSGILTPALNVLFNTSGIGQQGSSLENSLSMGANLGYSVMW